MVRAGCLRTQLVHRLGHLEQRRIGIQLGGDRQQKIGEIARPDVVAVHRLLSVTERVNTRRHILATEVGELRLLDDLDHAHKLSRRERVLHR